MFHLTSLICSNYSYSNSIRNQRVSNFVTEGNQNYTVMTTSKCLASSSLAAALTGEEEDCMEMFVISKETLH